MTKGIYNIIPGQEPKRPLLLALLGFLMIMFEKIWQNYIGFGAAHQVVDSPGWSIY